MNQRAYTVLDVKEFDDEQRIIKGIASTPAPDRHGDIVEPLGAKFKLPMPLLWQHSHSQPVGEVTFAKPTKDGIPFEARIAKTDEPGKLKERLDEAWQSVKLKLVKAVSIGFRSIEHSYMDNGGIKFKEWEWMELSLVTIPANSEATIDSIKSADRATRAALGIRDADRPQPPGDSGTKTKAASRGAVKLLPKGTEVKTIAEQIADLQATIEARKSAAAAIMQKAMDEGRTTDAAEAEEFDTISADVVKAEADLKRLQTLQSMNLSKAAPIETRPQPTAVAAAAAKASGGSSQYFHVQRNLPKGTAFTRYAMALARSKGNLMHAAEMAKSWTDTPEVETVLKAAVAAGNTTDANWASKLVEYETLASEFVELLRPATVIGRITGMRNVPFNVRMATQTGGGVYGWVGEGAAKPVGSLAIGELTLRWAKASGIIVITEELAQQSSPSAEAVVRDDMVAGIASFLDAQFIDPGVSEVTNVSPASVSNGVTPITASGTSADALRADLADMWAPMLAANLNVASGHFVMSPQMAMRLSLMLNPLGAREFPGISATGGTLEGYPVVTSNSVPSDSAGEKIFFVIANEVFFSEGGIMLDVSREASLQMDSAPDNPSDASTVMVSLWQRNLIGLRAERYINWKKRRAQAVGYITAANYTNSGS